MKIYTERSKKMRSESEIKNIIIDFALKDNSVRAVVLNGSRANPAVIPDKYQDFDVLFVVRDFDTFLSDKNWLSFLGNPILQQLPDEMALGNDYNSPSFAHLMIFEDGNRIDLTLFPLEKFSTDFKADSLTIVWVDKDKLFENNSTSSDKDYHIRKPTEREFLETSNEFWWVSTYVAKGLLRNDITYAKEILETVVRPMFMRLVEWKIGVENNFSVSFGKSGKFMGQYLAAEDYDKIMSTYADANIQRNWVALLEMTSLFRELQLELSEKLQFKLNTVEMNNAIEYLRLLRKGDNS